MSHMDELISSDIKQYLQKAKSQSALRIMICGGKAVGKSTLVDWILDRSNSQNSEKFVTTDKVIYGSFSTDKSKCCILDCLGDKECIQDLVAAASIVDLATIIVDASKGVDVQTKRHFYIAKLLGIKDVILAVNKMELVDYSQEIYSQILFEFNELAKLIDKDETCSFNIIALPIVALDGDNVFVRSDKLDWYNGKTLLQQIDKIQRISINADIIAPSEVADQFETTLIWFSDDEMLPGRSYMFNCGDQTAQATITSQKYKINNNSLRKEPANVLVKNEIGVCNIATNADIVFESFEYSSKFGSFTLTDRITKEIAGFGMIQFALRRSSNIRWQAMDVSKAERAKMKTQKPAVLWFTGLSGSGKSTIANLLEKKLASLGKHTYALDGDNVRHGLNKDLGFTDADRVENIRRVTQVAKLMVDAGLIVLTSFISPFRAERQMARAEIENSEFLEIFVETPLEVAEARDIKGLYKKARAGKIKNFTGIDSPYEPPLNSEIRVNTTKNSAEECADQILDELKRRKII